MVNLDLLAVNNGLVQFLDGGIRGGLVGHCHKSIALFGDVNISDFATTGEFTLQSIPGTPGINSIDKKLDRLLKHA
jgi:hypothetical protein